MVTGNLLAGLPSFHWNAMMGGAMTGSKVKDAGLRIICSNRVESLATELAARLIAPPLASPFSTEIIVVPSPAMARWLNLRLATLHGLAANISYPLPANWIWQLTNRLLDNTPQTDPLDRQSGAWRIHAMLPRLFTEPAFCDLRDYLPEKDDDVKRWQLATRIAGVFDRYQFYRPDLIRGWDAGRDDTWQALLWRELANTHHDTHRVAVLDRLIGFLRTEDPPVDPTQRVSLFAVSSLPPLLVQVLHSLATHIRVDLYQHSPTDQYWADLRTKKDLSRIRITAPDEATYFDTGNELLASWGRQGQALQDLLLDNDDLTAAHWEDYQRPPATTVLGLIQRSIFDLQASMTATATDDSIQIHVCHSPFRECQILHDNLLTLLGRDHDLRPEDILVLLPEVGRYAPYVEAVFRKDDANTKPFIPWNLSDTTQGDEHPLVRTFLQLLELPDSRFTISEVLSYLDVPEITQRFDLDESTCTAIRELLAQSQVRWGLDGEHKSELGLPAIAENTWGQAGERMFAGFALGGVEYWNGIAPLAEVEGELAAGMGRFWSLLETLKSHRQALAQPGTAIDWQMRLNRLIDDMFDQHGDDDARLQQVRDRLDDLVELADRQTLSPALLRHWLQTELANLAVRGRYFSGGVTFCGMRPMRSLPFRVICLVGMNEQAFPRRERPIEFDHMAERWLPGDPRAGDEDRYLLLETLLCVRRTLYISYTGRDLKNNGELQPSVLVRELTDFMDAHFPSPSATASTFSREITTIHSMQPFSPRHFTGPTAGHDSYWCEVAKSMSTVPTLPDETGWPTARVPTEEDPSPEIGLSGLLSFARHPIAFFFTRRLRIRLDGDMAPPEDDEIFAVDGLQAWNLKSILAQEHLRGNHTEDQTLRARGLLPHGVFADVALEKIQAEVRPFLAVLSDYVGQSPSPVLIDIPFPTVRLVGQVSGYFPGRGLLHYTPSKLKGKSLLVLWIEHLALCATEHLALDESSVLVCADAVRRFPPLQPDMARNHLQGYLAHCREGLLRPLPVLPKASFAWACNADQPDRARGRAIREWQGHEHSSIPGDRDDPYVQVVRRGLAGEPVDCPEFQQLAVEFFSAALEHGVVG